MNRRYFIKLLGAAAATVSAAELSWLVESAPETQERYYSNLNIADIDRLLKELYLPAVREQLNAPSVLWSLMR